MGWVQILAQRAAGVEGGDGEADAATSAPRAYQRSWAAALADQPASPPLAEARPRVVLSGVRAAAGPNQGLEARTALWLTVVAVLVLAIAASNVANLVLARALERRRETAVRLALGVSRTRLALQSLTEALLLSVVGVSVALAVAQWGGAAIRAVLAPGATTASILSQPRTVVVTAVLALLAATFLGVVPAVAAPGTLSPALRGGGRAGTGRAPRLRAGLLVAQGALTVVLLVGAFLFARSLDAVRRLPMGYQPDGVAIVRWVIQGPRPGDSAIRASRDGLMAAASLDPAVEAAAWVSSAPFISTSNTELFVAGIDSVGRLGDFTYQATTPDYFLTMGTRIVRGRGLTPDDRFGAPDVAVVSESMARVLWPGRNPLGECFRMRRETAPCHTVVGVAEDMIQNEIADGTRYHYYLSIDQYTRTSGWGMVLRVRGDLAREGEELRRRLQRSLPGTDYLTLRPLADVVATQQRSWRMGAAVFAAFGGLALLVAAVGLYGVIGCSVTERAHEIGVRMAVGAYRRHILSLVTGESLRLMLAGTGIGALVTVIAGRWVQPLLFQQSATDPGVLGLVIAVMAGVALAASAIPAFRAAGSDPNVVLRGE
ncbi:MAG: FtsX-like permease family protein [Gemmatimonadales bacterium]